MLKYGKCVIDVPIKPIPYLFITECLNPYYLFQLFSIGLWIYEEYLYYAYCIIFLSVLSTAVTLYDTVMNLRTIRKIAYYSCPINAVRGKGEDSLKAV